MLVGCECMFAWYWLADLCQEQGIPFWADPQLQRGEQINTNHGGRGFYFMDPAGHGLAA